MNNNLMTIIRRMLTALYALLSNPQAMRAAVAVFVICLVMLALLLPAVTALAGGAAIGGG